MLQLPPIQKLGFQNPWKIQRTMFFEMPRYNPNSITEQEKEDILGVARKAKEKGGKSYFGEVDQTVDEESQKEKEDLVGELKEFQDKTNLDQSKAIKKAQDCTKKWELDELKERLRKSGLEYLNNPKKKTGLIQKSLAYAPMHPAEKEAVNAKRKSLVKYIEGLPAVAKGSKESLAWVIAHFDEFVGPRIQFRNLLKNQTKFVQTLFFHLLAKEQDPEAHEPKILGKAMEMVKKVEGYPQAVQKEFYKAVESGNDPQKSCDEIVARFKKVSGDYDETVTKSEFFGGKFIQTPKGKMRAAKWEYMEWHKKEFDSLGKMEEMLKTLKESEIPKREREYAKRDELLSHLPPDQAEKLRGKTDEMRFHSFKVYIKDMESLVGKQSIHVLEYMAILESEEHEGFDLFTREEKNTLKADIIKDKPEVQELELQLLKAKSVQNRHDVVQEFIALPAHLRLGQRDKFKTMTLEQRKSFLQKVQTTQKKASTNPFAKIDDSLIDKKTREQQAIKKLRTTEGKNFLKGKMQTEKEGKKAAVIAETIDRTGSWVRQLEGWGLNQMAGRMREDSHYGLHGENDNMWKIGYDNSLAKNDEELKKGNTFIADDLLRNAGGDRKSGGEVVEGGLQEVTAQMVKDGDERIIQRLDDAVYDRAMFTGEDGKDELHMREKLKASWVDKKEMLVMAMLKFLDLEGASEEVIDELTYATTEINASFADTDEFFGIQEANSSDYFEEEEEESQAA